METSINCHASTASSRRAT